MGLLQFSQLKLLGEATHESSLKMVVNETWSQKG